MIVNVIKSQIGKKSLHITHAKIQQKFSIHMKDTTEWLISIQQSSCCAPQKGNLHFIFKS